MQQPRQTRVTGGIRLQPAHRHPTSQPAHRQHTSELEHLELGDTFIEARAGVQLVLSYDAPTDYGGKGTFRGTVKNTTQTPLHRVIVEVWLYFPSYWTPEECRTIPASCTSDVLHRPGTYRPAPLLRE